MSANIEEALYSPVIDSLPANLKNFEPEDFHPCSGSVLVVIPPPEDRVGSIHLPEIAQTPSQAAKVAAVPEDDKCPVRPGDWVFFRHSAAVTLELGGRKDLGLLNYSDGPSSEIIGFIRGSDL